MARPRTHKTRLSIDQLEDRSMPAAHALYAVTSDWGSGFQGQVTLSNDGQAPVAFSTLQFTLPSNITSIWDTKITSHVGTSYSVTNAGWNASIPAGGSVSFGFVASGPKTTATSFVLGGVALDSPVSPPTTPPTTPPVTPPVSPPVSPPTAASAQVSFKSTGDWGSGMNGAITIKNTGDTALSNWQVAFNLPGAISSVWNGTLVSHVGNTYTVKGADWNNTIPVGGSVEIGFGATPGGVVASGFVLKANGTTISQTPATNHSPVAAADSASTTTSKQVQVNVLANDTDSDGDTLTVLAAGPAGHGSVAVNANGSVNYTPAAGFTGTDSFGYTVSDGRGGSAVGTVTVQVTSPPVSPPPVSPPTSASSWPAHVFAPYVDATAWPTYDFVATARSSGVKYFTLAFITADPSKQAAWGGYASYNVSGTDFSNQMKSQINALRALGGDVAVSFGGASGQELAQVITNVNDLAAAYRSVIQTYGLTHIDFDIEGAAVADTASINRRSQAIAILQAEANAAGKELNVRFTLPVLPTGLDNNGLAVVRAAVQYGVRLDGVNVMAMDYGDSAAPNPNGKMGDYAIQAGTSLFNQLGQVYGSSLSDAQKWAMVGVTPMIGLNDVTTEKFDQQEARELEAWAVSHNIGLLSMWSLNRDRQNSAGAINYVDINSSSLVQSSLEFSMIFNAFTK